MTTLPEWQKWNRRERNREYHRKYLKTYRQHLEVKAKLKAYNQTPERKKYFGEYRQTHKRQAYAPENLQWLTAEENLRKGKKMIK